MILNYGQAEKLRESIQNGPRSLKAKTVVLGLKDAFALCDTLSMALKVVEAADRFNQKVDKLKSAIDGAFQFQAIHGLNYVGETWIIEKSELEDSLKPFTEGGEASRNLRGLSL